MTTKQQNFSGLTDDQVHQILMKIASQADVMANICRKKAEEHGTSDEAYVFHMLDSLACSLGALADIPSDGGFVGSFAAWIVGPSFEKNVTL